MKGYIPALARFFPAAISWDVTGAMGTIGAKDGANQSFKML